MVSPNDTAAEIQEKVGDWLAGGASVVWLLYPATPRLTPSQSCPVSVAV